MTSELGERHGNSQAKDVSEECTDPEQNPHQQIKSIGNKEKGTEGSCSTLPVEVAEINHFIPSILKEVLKELKAHSISNPSQRQNDPLLKVELWISGLLSMDSPRITGLPDVKSSISLVNKYLM